MSILNKMHQELQDSTTDSPVLSAIPRKKNKQKSLLFGLISLLLVSSITLSYLIYNQGGEDARFAKPIQTNDVLVIDTPAVKDVSKTNNSAPKPSQPKINQLAVDVVSDLSIDSNDPVEPNISAVNKKTVVSSELVVNHKPSVSQDPIVNEEPALLPASSIVSVTTPKPPTSSVESVVAKKSSPKKVIASETKKTSYLAITKSTLTDSELANIHLKKSEKALQKGDNVLASEEKRNALTIKPDLHEVRKKLALYYYSVDEQNQAINLLKKGAMLFPEYADFNLMLSRIALKNDDQQKAYLYLNQQPPKVEGHIDYHASYAILAQKFKKYEQAERLYQGILKHRPNNGRWLMSLAIVQDKQGKERLAVGNYQKALLKIDLSNNAKKYINQRLTYLANQ